MAHLVYSDSMGGSQHGQGVENFPSKTGSLKILLLHGNLDIWVKEAKNLPNMDLFHKRLGDMFGKFGTKMEGNMSSKITSDPYVTIAVSNAVIGRTFVISNTENFVWAQHFYVPVAHYAAEVQFVVKDSDVVGSQTMGAVGIPLEQILSGERVRGGYLSNTQCERETMQGRGCLDSINSVHTSGEIVPLSWWGGTRSFVSGCPWLYQHGQCWGDIYDAINQARRLVYITGWSVYHLVQLVRDYPNATDSRLGRLLKVKSQEGVRVLLLVWHDPTSRSILGYKTETSTIYTHYQKSVIVNADAGNYRRKIIAFVGGLDLCKGRYVAPKHPIFSTLQTVHKDDYHNHNFTASKPHGIQKIRASHDDNLLKLDRIPDILGIEEAANQRLDDPETWHVQVFHSIDSNTVKGFPEDPKEAPNKVKAFGSWSIFIEPGMWEEFTDRHEYTLQLMSRQFIASKISFIGNQYFLGSSYNWTNYKDLGANNLIPMEIALKIANKIKARERFSARDGGSISDTTKSSPTNTPQVLIRKNRHFMIYVHSKGMMVDDEYVTLGSANINERSLEGTRDTEIAMGWQAY
ncbi:unnamed protein product [Fraxinus pennsylvanica]|uniref:phospholipase D n=1 Tax=Fraxinus pennsylvanica TaxID=56036 RepID=A0AAD2AB10_9LAMI|nr:unnamed protein product [Fraxinus pennsylvanica]